MALTASSRLEVLQVYKLLQSVRNEDTSQVRKLCTQGLPMLINYRDPNLGECALHLAAQINNHAVTKFLINLGAYPNVKDCQGRTPVMRAADYGHDKTVATLVEAGADLKICDDMGHDVIFYCFSSSTNRHRKCLDLVMSKGADPNNTFDSDHPTLVAACKGGPENEEICLELINKGADPNSRDKINGMTALAEACSSKNVAAARALLSKGADPNINDKRKWTPLHHASEVGCLDIVKMLLAYGADVTAVDKEFNNPLHFAAEGGYGMICKYLGQRGCNPKEKNKDGFTPRLLAKEKSSKEASKELRKAEKLFTKYSKPDAVNPNRPEVLHVYDWVCEREAFVRNALMEAVVSPEEESEKKENELTQQSFCDVIEQIKAPLSKEIQSRILEAHEKDGKKIVNIDEFMTGKKYVSKAYLMAAFEGKKKKKGKKGKKGGKGKKGKLKIPMPICLDKDGPRRPDGGPPEKYLEKQLQWADTTRFDRDTPPVHPLQDDSSWYLQQPTKQYLSITDAVKFEDFQTLKRAFESGVDVDARDKYFKTPMMASCAEGNIELTTYLLSIGASVEARDNFKWTPLHHACHSGQLDVVKTLLYAGADGNAVTWNGATPLMRAIESGKVEVVRFLIDCNVSVTMRNKKDKSALDVAREWGSAEIYEMVKEKFDAAPKMKKDKKGNMRQPPLQPITLPELKIGLPEIVGATRTNYSDANGLQPETPRFHTWLDQKTRNQLLKQKEQKRLRFGEGVDFENYQKPLKQNIDEKILDAETEND